MIATGIAIQHDELEPEPKLGVKPKSKLDNTCLLGLLVDFEIPNKRVLYTYKHLGLLKSS